MRTLLGGQIVWNVLNPPEALNPRVPSQFSNLHVVNVCSRGPGSCCSTTEAPVITGDTGGAAWPLVHIPRVQMSTLLCRGSLLKKSTGETKGLCRQDHSSDPSP